MLGLDTATWTASVGVTCDGQAVAERTQRCEGNLAPAIVALIDAVLQAAGIGVTGLDAIAVSAGPGSFTGLRVGLSTAKGLAYAASAGLVAVPTLMAFANAAGPRDGTVCVMLDARKGEVYAAQFRWCDGRLEQTVGDSVVAPSSLMHRVDPPCTFIGDGVEIYGDVLRERYGTAATLLPPAAVPPSGIVVAQLGAELRAAGNDGSIAHLEPTYVRPSEAEVKAAKKPKLQHFHAAS